MSAKYLKNNEGIVRALTTNNLGLEKPMLNENYDIDVHNRNMDKIDGAIQEVKGRVDGLELKAERVSVADSENLFTATDVEGALAESKKAINTNTSNITNNKNDISSLKTKVAIVEGNISVLQSELGTNKTMLKSNINAIREVL